ncbi:MAG: hypothetical protein IKW77_01535 [Salinivirgaceae bacterium]|nr:hypothetical protein [Salinivirgaceae bacterium]
MKRKAPTSFLSFSGSVHCLAVSPNIITNIVYISNINRTCIAECNICTAFSDIRIPAEGGEMVLGRYAEGDKIGDVELGAS